MLAALVLDLVRREINISQTAYHKKRADEGQGVGFSGPKEREEKFNKSF
jgi:hypothetical protein